MKKILLVYPEYPSNTYWGFKHSLKYIGKKANMPPLGLITVAALLPKDYDLRLIDMNIEPLMDDDIRWADYVFTSTMIIQEPSLESVIQRANRLGVPVVAGGPHPSCVPGGIEGVSHLIIGEAEVILPRFLDDLEQGCLKPVYQTTEKPDISMTPIPRFDLIKRSAYGSMAIQYSRGCPYHCDFCDIWKLYGRRPRVKETDQFLAELQRLYDLGWRDSVFVVDDNFIGNPRRVKAFLKDLHVWQKEHSYPFYFFTEASINLANDDELLTLMREAGFNMVFLGIETPAVESLTESNKMLNVRCDLLESVRRIQAAGLEVSSGFIIGFDNDPPDICEQQIRFIEAAGIPMAMIGVLIAVPGTELYKRLEREGRLLGDIVGNNTHRFITNFKSHLPAEQVASRYKRIISTIYDKNLKNYFKRSRKLIRQLGPNPYGTRSAKISEILAFFRSLFAIITHRWGWQYFKFLIWCVCKRLQYFPEAVRLAIMGFHFQAITKVAIKMHDVESDFVRMESEFEGELLDLTNEDHREKTPVSEFARQLYRKRARICKRFKRRINHLGSGFRSEAEASYERFLCKIDEIITTIIPPAYRLVTRGADLWKETQGYFLCEKEAFFQRYDDLCKRANCEVGDLQRALKYMYHFRRRKLREARRRIRLLPCEYRLLAKREYKLFQQTLTEMLTNALIVKRNVA